MIIRPTWIQINLSSINHNLNYFQNKLSNYNLCAVVKANAYGHGVIEVSKVVADAGVSFLAVATPEEALELQKEVDIPVIIIGLLDFINLNNQDEQVLVRLLGKNIRITVCSSENIKILQVISQRFHISINVHIKIDSGMNRIGIKNENELIELLVVIKNSPNIELEGVFTHFSKADEINKETTIQQKARFQKFINIIKEHGFDLPVIHSANSASMWWDDEPIGNMVRLGISLYGECPSNDVGDFSVLKQALTWKTRISHIKQISKGEAVSYGDTWITKQDSVIATLPVGYADGYRRSIGNKGYVLIHGQKAPVVGRVCMDQCMVNISEIDGAKIGDEVVLFGKQGTVTITATQMAEWQDTINYEVLTSISSRVPRIYVK